MRHKDESFYYLSNNDIICFSESWLTPRVGAPVITYAGYKYIRHDRVDGRKGGGLIIYIKESLFPYAEEIHDVTYMDAISEEIWITLSNPGWKKAIVGLVYRPPSGKHDLFCQRIEATLDKLNTDLNAVNRDLVILGDFNIDFSQTQNPVRSRLITTMGDNGLRQIIKKPTRVTNNSKSTIDLVFTNINSALINSAGVIELSISDRKPVYLIKKSKRHKHPKRTVMTRNYRNYNRDMFENILLDNHSWHTF